MRKKVRKETINGYWSRDAALEIFSSTIQQHLFFRKFCSCGPSFGCLTCEKALLFLIKHSFIAGLAIVSSIGQNVKKA